MRDLAGALESKNIDFWEGIQTSDFSVDIEFFTDKSGKCRKNFTRTGKTVRDNTGRARTAAERERKEMSKKGTRRLPLTFF